MPLNALTDRPLPESARRDVSVFVKHHSVLAGVLQASLAASPDISPTPLFKSLADQFDMSRADVQAIFMTLNNLAILTEEFGSIDDTLAFIKRNLSEDDMKTWDDHRSEYSNAMRIYGDDNPVALSIKAQRLSYEHERLFTRADILTDARPVFSGRGDRVLEVVVTHVLAIVYNKDRRSESIYLALDADDIVKLKKACERAETKADTLKKSLSELGLSTKVLNDPAGQ